MSREDIECIDVQNTVEHATGEKVFVVYRPKVNKRFRGPAVKTWHVKLRSGKMVTAVTSKEDTKVFRMEGGHLLPFPMEVGR